MIDMLQLESRSADRLLGYMSRNRGDRKFELVRVVGLLELFKAKKRQKCCRHYSKLGGVVKRHYSHRLG